MRSISASVLDEASSEQSRLRSASVWAGTVVRYLAKHADVDTVKYLRAGVYVLGVPPDGAEYQLSISAVQCPPYFPSAVTLLHSASLASVAGTSKGEGHACGEGSAVLGAGQRRDGCSLSPILIIFAIKSGSHQPSITEHPEPAQATLQREESCHEILPTSKRTGGLCIVVCRHIGPGPSL
jgi:hypothetical protein